MTLGDLVMPGAHFVLSAEEACGFVDVQSWIYVLKWMMQVAVAGVTRSLDLRRSYSHS